MHLTVYDQGTWAIFGFRYGGRDNLLDMDLRYAYGRAKPAQRGPFHLWTKYMGKI
jgi:hypothetical protein